ncbi:exopolysaccharide biosynthesis protein [Notoacmeibacter sp. MSK16QG-6]|uniref:exopolysaccharide biosynthesis protein n=1 Tax=Notoacmeibacter sp. MSK16QG-6 TaxID=2957982 RepID=UPI00209F420F|nr:exopolysaccharide biosynthesis protein [Notoacmeibacter sp. MSK16QG-6]MCP1199613.1 exopolysaccharide biosynthesis protein [Notoacmeibacter sp. MSK16QG-6]
MDLPARQRPPYRRLSEVLRQIEPETDGSVGIRTIADALGDRSFATILMVFASFNLLPLPFGTSVFLGIPLVIIAWQMVMRQERVWLPRFILKRYLPAKAWRFLIDRIVPLIEKGERFIKPRYWPANRARAERMIGFLLLILGIAVVMPIPLGNWLPALACFTVALGLSERDGIVLAIGTLIGAASLIIIALVLSGAGFAVEWVSEKIDALPHDPPRP